MRCGTQPAPPRGRYEWSVESATHYGECTPLPCPVPVEAVVLPRPLLLQGQELPQGGLHRPRRRLCSWSRHCASATFAQQRGHGHGLPS